MKLKCSDGDLKQVSYFLIVRNLWLVGDKFYKAEIFSADENRQPSEL